MNENWREIFVVYLQKLLPLLSALLLLFVSYMPALPMVFHPSISVICVYYWMLHRPDVFNLFSVFVLGLVQDLISSAPWGSNVFGLLILFVLASNFLKYFNGKPFEVIWAGFVPAAFAAMFAKWFILSVYYSQFLPLGRLFLSFLITIAIYPVISLVNVFVQNKLMTDEV